LDVEPFESGSGQFVARRIGSTDAKAPGPRKRLRRGFKVEQGHRRSGAAVGNSVRARGRIVKAGEIRRGFELNTAIVKAFHRMILMDARADAQWIRSTTALKVAASGLGAQSERLRIVSENLANAQSTGKHARRIPTSARPSLSGPSSTVNGGEFVASPTSIARDPESAFPVEFDARPRGRRRDAGYVKMPNVNTLIEMADMSEANRSYEANLQVIKQARELISMTIDLMRSQG
jgi:flagellar basal-body rod protein FlgC